MYLYPGPRYRDVTDKSYHRKDVQHLVEAYYREKSTAPSGKPSRGRPEKGTTNSLGQPPKDGNTPRGRGRPPKDSNALRGRPSKVTKGTRGLPPKDGNAPRGRGRPPKVASTEQVSQPKSNPPRGLGRPPKAANTESVSQPKSSGGRRGRPPKVRPSEVEQN